MFTHYLSFNMLLLFTQESSYGKICWFFKNILIHETITKVCVLGGWGGGGNCSSIYTQVLKFKSRTYQILTV